ncbi:MAG TPA: hypothetical protein VF641_01175 [Methylobacterium sp.]
MQVLKTYADGSITVTTDNFCRLARHCEALEPRGGRYAAARRSAI